MARTLFSQLYKEDLTELTQRLEKEYYNEIDAVCKHAARHAAELEETESHPSSILYITLCVKLIDEIRFHIRLRKDLTIPYLYTLAQKATGSHDCRTCSGVCKVQHTLQMQNLREAHHRISELLERIQQLTKPLYLENDSPLNYKILRNEVMIIDNALTDLFYIEESVLIPKVAELQNAIHVTS
ncbi:MAG: hypothetical protein EOP49_03150 [Sphingobacteriales bacterium]|nr:MAG: hypothetical protein EOP49_03150 [Sphingobacteriales bacterium]